MNGILIIAHAPLAHALRECALHVFADAREAVFAFDVQPDAPPEHSVATARRMLADSGAAGTLVLSDVVGATPCNVARQLLDGPQVRLIAGVNLPMLLRALCYRGEPLDALVQRALDGGSRGVLQLGADEVRPPPEKKS